MTKPIHETAAPWPDILKQQWEHSLSLAVGVFSIEGEVLRANRGMAELLKLEVKTTPRTSLFRAPTFERLVASPESEKPVFEGVITIGDGHGAGVSLLGKVFRRPGLVLMSCEYDTNDLTQSNETLALLNHQVTNLQRELIREKHELGRTLEALHEANDHLAELNAEKDRFVGMAAHDLRNALTVIRSYAIMLAQPDLLDEGATAQALQVTQRVANTTLGFVNDLLDIATIERGQIDLRKVEVDLSEFIKQIAGFNQVIAAAKNIKLTEFLEKGLGRWVFDPDRIEQVLNNLISNAFKFSNPETTVSLMIRRNEDDLEFVVEDQGLGIPPSELPMVFRDFTKTTTQATGGERGSGLGLAICRRIVDLHDGEIFVESSPGEGSRFYFRLPPQQPSAVRRPTTS